MVKDGPLDKSALDRDKEENEPAGGREITKEAKQLQ
jgi:hypothetical protein